MKYINCPNCGCKLFEGADGSHIILKCNKCNNLFEATVEPSNVVVILKNKCVKQELHKK